MKYYNLKFATTDQGSIQPRKLSVLDRLVLRLVNLEVNYKMDKNMELRYDMHYDQMPEVSGKVNKN